jgi:hypothetical protein
MGKLFTGGKEMAVKPCRLAILKRYPDPEHVDLFQDPAPAQYYDQINDHWVTYKSNATLFNKTDLKRDFLEDVAMFQKHQIKLEDGQIVPTVLEMEELIEKKVMGYLIRQHTPTSDGKSLTRYLIAPRIGTTVPWDWSDDVYKAEIIKEEDKDAIVSNLKKEFLEGQFSVKELYWEER